MSKFNLLKMILALGKTKLIICGVITTLTLGTIGGTFYYNQHKNVSSDLQKNQKDELTTAAAESSKELEKEEKKTEEETKIEEVKVDENKPTETASSAEVKDTSEANTSANKPSTNTEGTTTKPNTTSNGGTTTPPTSNNQTTTGGGNTGGGGTTTPTQPPTTPTEPAKPTYETFKGYMWHPTDPRNHHRAGSYGNLNLFNNLLANKSTVTNINQQVFYAVEGLSLGFDADYIKKQFMNKLVGGKYLITDFQVTYYSTPFKKENGSKSYQEVYDSFKEKGINNVPSGLMSVGCGYYMTFDDNDNFGGVRVIIKYKEV